MKLFSRLLSSLLVASLALLPGSVAWSGASAGKERSKAAKGAVKRAPLADGKAKRLAKVAEPAPQAPAAPTPAPGASLPHAALPKIPIPKVPATQAQAALAPLPAVAPPAAPVRLGPPAPASTLAPPLSPQIKPNPYLPGAVAVEKNSQVNPYLPSAAPTPSVQPAGAKSRAGEVAVVAKPEPVASKPAPVVATAAPTLVVATPSVAAPPAAAPAAKPAPGTAAASAIDVASEQAWAKIAANPALAPRQAIPVAPVAAPTSGNPYLAYRVAYAPAAAPVAPAPTTAGDAGQLLNTLRNFLPEPHLPSPDIDVLPSITKVYPTGDRPMYVLTFKCPTELVGITPPPTKALRWLITSGMEAVNSTNLLPFSMQQVCQ